MPSFGISVLMSCKPLCFSQPHDFNLARLSSGDLFLRGRKAGDNNKGEEDEAAER